MFGATAMNFPPYEKSAVLSDCGKYRYVLSRTWGTGAPMVFVMLNPSTADADKDDATIRKCIGFAKHFGYRGIRVVNLFAWRSRDPKALREALDRDTVGPDNDEWIRRETAYSLHPVVAAWGANGRHFSTRVRRVLGVINRPVQALRVTKDGHPEHPVMLPYDLKLAMWEPRQ